MTPPAPPPSRRNRTVLLAIAGLFFGSLLLAGVLRFSGWHPAATRNHGELLQPPADLRGLAPRLADGTDYAWQPAARIWRVVLAPPADCGADCARLAHDLDVVWRLMGKDADHVQVLWLCARPGCQVPAPLRDDPSVRVLHPDARLRAALPDADPRPREAAGGVPVYVVDPNGFAILRYPPGSDPGGLRADLAKLLKLM